MGKQEKKSKGKRKKSKNSEDEADQLIQREEQRFADPDPIEVLPVADTADSVVILDQEEELTDYEKIQQRTKKAKEDLKKEIEVKLSAKKTRPSKALKSHMENMKENGSSTKAVSVDLTDIAKTMSRESSPTEKWKRAFGGPEKRSSRKNSADSNKSISSVHSSVSTTNQEKSIPDAAKTNTSTIPEEQTVDMDVSTQNDKVEERTSSDNHDTNKPESNSANIEIVEIVESTSNKRSIPDNSKNALSMNKSSPIPSKTALSNNKKSPVKNLSKERSTPAKSLDDTGTADIDDIISSAIKDRMKKRALQGDETFSSVKKKRRNEVEIQYSDVRFSDFGGNDDLLCEICKLLAHLKHPELYNELGVSPPRGFLLHGPPGCGKSLLACAIVGELELPFFKIAAPELVSGVSGDSESKIRDLFDQATEKAPCVLFIDEIDCITAKRENAQRQMEGRIVAQLLTCLDDLGTRDSQVVVIGATNRPDSLDPALRRAGRFDREIGLGIPDRQARHKILSVLCRNLRLDDDVSLLTIATLSPGYVGADLSSLVREAAIAAVNRMFTTLQGQQTLQLQQLLEWLKDTPPVPPEQMKILSIKQQDFQDALKVVQPSAKREGFATVPGVSWSDVGALQNIREELQLSILAPVRFQEEFESLGLPASSGVLLAGPPGCGKTLVAKAIANEAGINFISVKGPELLNMYVGESERAVRACFARARTSAPCVIFFDEIDSLCPRRSGHSSDGGSSSRVVNQLLTEMDGVQVRNGVFLMAATNRPDILDPAVLRPGRLDKILYVGFPEPQDRSQILKALTKNGSRPQLGQDVDLEVIGADVRCDGYTGADLSALVREASMSALKQRLNDNIQDGSKICVNKQNFETAFEKVRPSVDQKDRNKYQAMKLKYTKNIPNSESIIGKDSSAKEDVVEKRNRQEQPPEVPREANVNKLNRKAVEKDKSLDMNAKEKSVTSKNRNVEVSEISKEVSNIIEERSEVNKDSVRNEKDSNDEYDMISNDNQQQENADDHVNEDIEMESDNADECMAQSNNIEFSNSAKAKNADLNVILNITNHLIRENGKDPGHIPEKEIDDNVTFNDPIDKNSKETNNDEYSEEAFHKDDTDDAIEKDADDGNDWRMKQLRMEDEVTEDSKDDQEVADNLKDDQELAEDLKDDQEMAEVSKDDHEGAEVSKDDQEVGEVLKGHQEMDEQVTEAIDTHKEEDSINNKEILVDEDKEAANADNDKEVDTFVELTIEDETSKTKSNKKVGSIEKSILDFLNDGTREKGENGNVVEKKIDDSKNVTPKRTKEMKIENGESATLDTGTPDRSKSGAAGVDGENLRYLQDMMIRVKDTSKVPSAAGKTGIVKNIRKNNKVTVLLEGINFDGSKSQRVVPSHELEPFMPEEGDKVKLLLTGASDEVGQVVGIDEEDICEVKIGDFTDYIQVDNLCKIEVK